MVDVRTVLDDLAAESAWLDAVVAELPEKDWARPTPAEGWTIAHQIAHLAWTDDKSVLAATDPEGFAAQLQELMGQQNPWGIVDDGAEEGARQSPAELLRRWRSGRATLDEALTAVPAGSKIPWFGPPMSAPAMATARIMETWAHGLDVADALGVRREQTARLRHVAHIGVRARDFAFAMNGAQAPGEPFRVELTGPAGEAWTWGPEDAAQRVTGSALDFCYLVTQRRHRDDTELVAEGADADRWLDIAQAFAGPSGSGRKAGQFS